MFRLLAAACMLISAQQVRAETMIEVQSTRPVAETLDRVQTFVAANGFVVVARVDHAGAAAKAGLTLRPTEVLIFGNPKGGTPVMQCDQRAGIDLPLKALAWQDEAGKVWLGMTDPTELKARYRLTERCDPALEAMRSAAQRILDAGK